MTPHISGFYHLKATHDRVVEILVENLKHFYAGEPLTRDLVFFHRLPQAAHGLREGTE